MDDNIIDVRPFLTRFFEAVMNDVEVPYREFVFPVNPENSE